MLKGIVETQRQLGRTFPLYAHVRGSAVFSDCGNYRPYLSRGWAAGPTIMWLCMNPSSATNALDDATSRKLTRHSQRLGFGRLFLLNVMDYRETEPSELPENNERSGRNLEYIERCARHADTIVLAYGKLRSKQAWREYATQATDACGQASFMSVLINKDGSPRHPRRFPADFQLEVHEFTNTDE
jgi:hypothetical protein